MSTSGTIGGVAVMIDETRPLSIQTKLDERDRATFTAVDTTGTAIFSKGQKVTITETVAGLLFTGYVNTAKRNNLVPNPFVSWDIDCLPPQYALDKRTSNRQYTYQYAGAIVADLYNRYMAPEGVIASTAVQIVTTPADWNMGSLSGVVGASTVGDGDLELLSSDSLSATFNSTAQWNTGTLTNVGTGTQGDIALVGQTKNWDDGNKGTRTLYGQGSPSDSISSGAYRLFCSANNETRARQDWAGTWQNGTIEVDIVLAGDNLFPGFTFRTTNFTNGDSSYGYCIELTTSKIAIRKGTNGGGATSSELASVSFSPHLSPGTYRVRGVMNGSTLSAYLNGTFQCSATDSSYSAAGYIALRNRDGSNSSLNQQFDNFGVMTALSGTWVSPAQALDAITTIAGTVVSWDASLNAATIKVETSVDNGASYQSASNGGSIQNLTIGGSGAGKTLKIRVTLSTTTTVNIADIKNLQWTVQGGYVASGVRSTAPLGIDSMKRPNQSGLGTAFDGQVYTKFGTGTDSIISNRAKIESLTTDVYEVLGNSSWTDLDATVRIELSTGTIAAGLALRFVDINNWFRVLASATQLIASKNIAGTITTIATVSKTLSTGTPYFMRFRLFNTGPATLQSRVWLPGQIEPTNWDINTTS